MRDEQIITVLVQFTLVIALTAFLLAIIVCALWALWTTFDIMGGIVGAAWLAGCVFITWRMLRQDIRGR